MRCLACEWKSRNVSNLTFCPSCGLADMFYYYKEDVDDASHASDPVDNFPQPVHKPVDNFFEI